MDHFDHDHHQFEVDLAEKLRSLGYRFTPQRRVVMDAVQHIQGHFTPQTVCNQINASAVNKSTKADQATVYRTLELFQKIGILYSSQVHGQTVFELAGEVPHHHLVCRNCNKVMALDDHHFDHLVQHLYEDHQFKAELAHLTISGLCDHCQ
ncbi:MAG: Fur family transcriptional regulator [Anaerolineae bacterium]